MARGRRIDEWLRAVHMGEEEKERRCHGEAKEERRKRKKENKRMGKKKG